MTWALVAIAVSVLLWVAWRLKGRRLNLRRARRFLAWQPAWAALSGIFLGAALGFFAGISFHRERLASSERALYQLGAVQWYSSYAQAVYQLGDYENGSAALNRQIRFLQSILQNVDRAERASLEYEIGMAHARLFALAEAFGETAAADAAWRKAAGLLEGAHWSDVSKERIRQVLERMDGGLPTARDGEEGS
jgi:hypothetical protein